MSRPTYCTALDVLRRFDPQIDQTALDGKEFIGNNDEEQVIARIEGVESKFEREARPLREVRVGAGPGSYVYKSAKGRGFPVHVYLDHMQIVPIDPAAGDVIERRTGRDNWVDITNQEGSAWVADYRKGKLTVFELPGRGHLPVLRNYRDRYIRISYRHGALGGDPRAGGQATLGENLTQGQTGTVSVTDAGRLPGTGGTMLIDGAEYVEIAAVDLENNTVDIAARGLRGTADAARSSGDILHYCPMDVREAIASLTAREAVLYDDWTDQLIDTASGPKPAPKLDEWKQEFDDAVANYTDNYGYK